MTTRKELAEQALKHPENFTKAELVFFRLWLKYHRKER
jgi:hypothetical protein